MRGATDPVPTIEETVRALLRRAGLAGQEPLVVAPLTGGVSSDIFQVETAAGPVVVKRALPKLRVAADWRAPVERNANEVAWLEVAGGVVPDSAPRVLAHDPEAGLFAMDYLDPAAHPVWKGELRDGRVDAGFAAEVGRRMARIHSATAGRADLARRFATDAIFKPIRLEPYIEATAERHPAVADALTALSRDTLATRIALVHGDVSPKNILVGPRGPVFLDAECAWYGDPAFDIAFCLNHLLLKCLWNRPAAPLFLDAFAAMRDAYLDGTDWERRQALERRAGRLLPALFLARIDGKSPVEYVTEEVARDLVRRTALPLIAEPPATLLAVRDAWAASLASRQETT